MTFYLKLKGNKYKARKFIEAAKQKHEQELMVIDTWVNNHSDFNVDDAINMWEDFRKQYGDLFLKEALHTYAIANSVLDVNAILANHLKMQGAAIETELINNLLTKLFIINITNILISKSSLTDIAKHEIIIRTIARQFPNKETKAPQTIPYTIQDIKKQVENFVSKEDEPIDRGD